MKKALAALALAGTLTLIGTVPAMATTYPAPGQDEQGQVDNGDIQEGEPFDFSGDGFGANEEVRVEVQQINGPQAAASLSGGAAMSASTKIDVQLAPQTFATRANANGHFSIPLTINSAGTYRLTAIGVTTGHRVTATVTVKKAKGATLSNTGSNLANTGADSGLMLWSLVGAGALAAGAASVVVVRRRAKADVTAA